MTDSLKNAFDRASKLPQVDHEWLAYWIVEAIESEERWNELFAESHDMLARMGEEAIKEVRARRK